MNLKHYAYGDKFPHLAATEAPSMLREDVKIPIYKPHTNPKRSSVRSHTLAPTSMCDLSHSFCWRPLTDLGHISTVSYVCHPLWFVCGHRKGILTSPLKCPDYRIRESLLFTINSATNSQKPAPLLLISSHVSGHISAFHCTMYAFHTLEPIDQP